MVAAEERNLVRATHVGVEIRACSITQDTRGVAASDLRMGLQPPPPQGCSLQHVPRKKATSSSGLASIMLAWSMKAQPPGKRSAKKMLSRCASPWTRVKGGVVHCVTTRGAALVRRSDQSRSGAKVSGSQARIARRALESE